MLDKKHDGFFDEKTPEDCQADEFLKMLDGHDKQVKSFAVGEKVTGKVTQVGSEYICVDIGARNEALMKVIELTDKDGILSVGVGDEVGGFIVSLAGGETIISKRMGDGSNAGIDALREALNTRVPVQGKVTGVSKAGLTVKIMGHRAFCPISQIDVKYTSDVNEYLSKELDFVITRITEGGKNIVVSRVPLFEAGLEEQFKLFTETAGTNKILKGKISKIVEFGLFVETNGLEGLVHISEVSWERAQNLNDKFTVGQEVEFVVLKVERKDSLRNSKISLSLKQALEDPWTKVTETLTVGESVDGKVTRLADFGAFVEVFTGVEGLVHVSEMAWGRRVHHPSEIVKPEQIVRVMILGIDQNKRSISLTLKDISSDPWNGIEEKLAVGADVSGVVARKAKFGYFIDLFEGVTGLLVFSRMSADKKDALKPGDEVTVQVESIDTDSRRVALSMGISGEANNRENDEAKLYIKKQNAAKQEKKGGGDTEFGEALKAAVKKKAVTAIAAVVTEAIPAKIATSAASTEKATAPASIVEKMAVTATAATAPSTEKNIAVTAAAPPTEDATMVMAGTSVE